MRSVLNKQTGEVRTLYPYWTGFEYTYLPINSYWEIVKDG